MIIKDELFGSTSDTLFILHTLNDDLGGPSAPDIGIVLVLRDSATRKDQTIFPVRRYEFSKVSEQAQIHELLSENEVFDPYAVLRAHGPRHFRFHGRTNNLPQIRAEDTAEPDDGTFDFAASDLHGHIVETLRFTRAPPASTKLSRPT